MVFVHFGELEGLSPRLSKLRGIFSTYEAAVEFKKRLLNTNTTEDSDISHRMYGDAEVSYSIHEIESDIESGSVVCISV